MKDRLIELLQDDSLTLGLDVLPETAAAQLMLYLTEWKKWNAKINLTADTDELSVINIHIHESLQYARAISPIGSLADLGSGAGFPGIPVKVVFPTLDMVLVESQRKRVNYLKTVIRSMGLEKIKCVHGRVEDFSDFLRSYDFVILRHVLQPNFSLQLGAGLLNTKGRLILQTGPDVSFQADFTNSICLSLVNEIFVKRSNNSASKLMVFERNSDEYLFPIP